MSILLISAKELTKNSPLSRINHYMKQNRKETLPFIISCHFSYCPLISMFCSKKSTKKINAVHEKSLRIIRNGYESVYPLVLKEAHQVTFHQRCINSPMMEAYKYLNGHSPEIMNYIFKLREKM